jgi:hypothetical protein
MKLKFKKGENEMKIKYVVGKILNFFDTGVAHLVIFAEGRENARIFEKILWDMLDMGPIGNVTIVDMGNEKFKFVVNFQDRVYLRMMRNLQSKGLNLRQIDPKDDVYTDILIKYNPKK